MAGNDQELYSYQRPAPSKLAERAMISLERTQKLDLLIHLLTNLQQSLVICGPNGIGKTTLLTALQDSRGDRWQFCYLAGSSALSFEAILQQLSRALNVFGSSIQLDISALRASCRQQKVILIIDDAGDLAPGLIGELETFAANLDGLRLVLAMTYDEFHIKSGSDAVLDEFHVIELPPLTRKQCLDYLQNLSSHPNMPLTFNGINDTLVDELYRETHGIPGRILAELPKLEQYQGRHQKKWWIAVALLLPLALAAYVTDGLYDDRSQSAAGQPAAAFALPSPTPTAEPSPPGVSPAPQQVAASATPTPAPTASPTITAAPTVAPSPTIKPSATSKATASPTPQPTASLTPTSAPTLTTTPPPLTSPLPSAIASATPIVSVLPTPNAEAANKVIKPLDKAVSPTPMAEKSNADDDQEWINAQPGDNYTLQVMTLSSRDGVRRFKRKYAEYGDSLKAYTLQRGDQEKYILIYGSFESSAEAKRFKEIMPAEFKQALEKRFRGIQK